MPYDVAIIGGGPAGSSAAITLARAGANVVLLERAHFPRHKVCGEFVSAESLDMLHALLGAAESEFLNSSIRIDRTRVFLDGRAVSAAIKPAAASVTRYELDLALWNAAVRAGVECRDHCEVVDVIFTGKLFAIKTRTQGTLNAHMVVDAAGRWSRLRNDPVPPGPKWIGLKCHFDRTAEQRDPGSASSVDLYFFDGGYCGVQPIAPGIVNACAMVRSDRATTLDEVFALHRALRARAQTWRPIFAPISTAPLVFRAAEPIRPPLHITAAEAGMPETGYGQVIICVGDAAAFIDPFVGDGISLAIRTGVAAAEALGPQPDGDRSSLPSALAYAARYERDFVPILKSAARVRSLFYKPRALRLAALTAMRLPFVADYVIRRTRAVT